MKAINSDKSPPIRMSNKEFFLTFLNLELCYIAPTRGALNHEDQQQESLRVR
jgi:hypothetical protein